MDVHQKKGAQMSMNVNGNGYNPYLQRTSSSSKTTGANNVDSTGETKEEKIKKLELDYNKEKNNYDELLLKNRELHSVENIKRKSK